MSTWLEWRAERAWPVEPVWEAVEAAEAVPAARLGKAAVGSPVALFWAALMEALVVWAESQAGSTAPGWVLIWQQAVHRMIVPAA